MERKIPNLTLFPYQIFYFFDASIVSEDSAKKKKDLSSVLYYNSRLFSITCNIHKNMNFTFLKYCFQKFHGGLVIHYTLKRKSSHSTIQENNKNHNKIKIVTNKNNIYTKGKKEKKTTKYYIQFHIVEVSHQYTSVKGS
jgi:hypothetical protein